MNFTTMFTAATALSLLNVSNASADVSFDGILNNETSSFGIDFEGSLASEVSVSVDSPGVFDVDFATLGETEFSVTWRTPRGQFIEITPPTGFQNVNLFVNFLFGSGGSFFSPGFEQNPLDIVITGESGAPLPISFTSLGLTGEGGTAGSVFLNVDIVPGETYRLESITATGTVAADYNVDFDNLPIDRFGIFGEAFTDDFATADPGQWVRIVPTPGTAGILGGAVLAAVRRRRRSKDL